MASVTSCHQNVQITDSNMSFVSIPARDRTGKWWHHTFWRGISEADVQQFKGNSPKLTRKQIYAVLSRWLLEKRKMPLWKIYSKLWRKHMVLPKAIWMYLMKMDVFTGSCQASYSTIFQQIWWKIWTEHVRNGIHMDLCSS